jgi:hypothetical protein
VPNRFSRLLLPAVLTLLAVAPAANAATFPDKNLAAAVQAELKLAKPEFKDEDLARLSILHATGKSIKDLTGLEKCKSLLEIRMDKNQISNLKPLKDLTMLQSLDLAGNKVSDITPLAGLTGLQYLVLENNQVADLKSLVKLTALQALYLGQNKISDLKPLAGLTKLASLSLPGNQVKDLSPLSTVTRINSLDLGDNQIADVTPLAKQTQLSLLQLQKNKITDLAPLVTWAKADADKDKRFAPYLRLYLEGNPLSKEAEAKQLPALKAAGVRLMKIDKPKED